MCEQEENKTTESGSGCFKFIVGLMTICIIIGIAWGLFQANTTNSNNDGGKTFLSRSAKNSDISFEVNDDFSLRVSFEIVPKVDIDDLQLTFKFLDDDGKLLTTKTKLLGNVKKGSTYNVNFSLTEFSFSQLLNLNSCSTSVTGGTVSYFA